MDLRVLHYFLTVAREQSFTKAAEHYTANVIQTACSAGGGTWRKAF